MSVSVQTGAQQTPRHQQSSGTSSLLACVRESSPLPDPAEGDAAFDSYTGTTGTEPRSKKSRFHPLRGLRRMFRRKPRAEPTAAPESVPAGETVSGEPTGSSLLVPDNGGQPRSRSASELLGSSQELQAKRRSGGGLSGGSGGGSGCALGGGLSVSHDSVFTSDGRGGGGSPRGGSALQLPGAGELDGAGGGASASAHMLAPQPIASHAGVRAELFEAVRRRRRGRNGRRSEDEEDEDLGLPSSPYGGSPTTADVLMERSGIKEAPTKSHSTCSDGSLLSMGSSEMDEDSQVSGHSSKVSLHDRAPPPHEPAAAFGGTDFDLEMVGESLGAPLSHSAALHRIAVRPRRTHGAPRHHRRTQQMSSMVLPTTPEANEEFPRSYSPDNRGKRDPCLPESHGDSCDTAEQQQTSPEPMFRCSSPPNGGMPLPLFFHPNPRPSIPAGLSPNSPEALLASVMLERQLKSASLPPGLALPPAAPPASQEPTVKLSRSQSSSDPAGSPPGRHNFRKAHSAARIEHQAALANEALFKSRAMFGGDAKEEKSPVGQPEPTSPMKEEKPLRSPVRKTSEDLPSPSHEEKTFVKPPPKPELPPSMKEDKPVFYKPPHSRKTEIPEPKSPVRLSEDMELPPVPGPKPESRKMSNVAMRQRMDPGVVSPEPPEEYSPPPWAPPSSTKMSTSHFIKLSDPCEADSLALRHKEMQERKLSSIKTRVSGFQSLLQDAPSSLDSLEIENQAARRLRSLSQSPVDSLERTELKMSSDSLSSGADLSSTSDDPRPYRKHSRPRRPTPDTSDPEETKPPAPAPRPIKLRSVSRHSDPPFSGKNAVEVTSVIRKSVSVDSIRSSYSEHITENQSNNQLPTTKASTSNDSISSYDTNDSEKISNVQEAAPLPVTKVRSHLKSDTKPVDITPLESSHLSLKCESVKTETETSKSPPVRWESKLPRMSLSTPSVPEFLRVQLNHVDSTPASNVVLSANAASPVEVAVEPKRQRLPSDKQEEEPENEITSARVRLRKSFIEEPKVVDIAEKKQVSTDSPAHILNRRPSQIKRLQELSIRVENDTKPQKIEVISPTEKVAPRAIAALVKEAEAKPKTETVVEKRYSSTFIQPKLSVATPQLKSVEVKPVKHNMTANEPISNITIVSKATAVVSEPKESRANGVFTAKPVQTEKPAPAPKQVAAPAPKVMAPPPKVVAVEKSEPAPEVVLRKKAAVTHEAKDDQPELMKVFARRSLKLKDTETWESQGSTQRSRDSDKENEDCPTELREKKVTESKSFNNSVTNNNVPATVISNTNNNNNGFSRKVPRAVSMASVPSNSNHTNNNLEAVNTEVTLRQRSPENRPRPSSLADRIQGVWGGRNVELVPSSAAAPAAPVPAAVATDNTVDRSLTPRVRRRLDEWERWSKQTSRKEALP